MARRSTALDLFFFTNRAPEANPKEGQSYGAERCKSLAFGSVRVDVGLGLDWNEQEIPPHLRSTGRMTIYASDADRALWASTMLFGSEGRLGRVGPGDLTDHMCELLTEADFIDVIQVPSDSLDFLGHSYFSRHPAVSSDLVALICYGWDRQDSRRALRPVEPPTFWMIEDSTDTGR